MEGQLNSLAANKAADERSVFAHTCPYTFIHADACAHKLPPVYLSLFVIACEAPFALFARGRVCLLPRRSPAALGEQ